MLIESTFATALGDRVHELSFHFSSLTARSNFAAISRYAVSLDSLLLQSALSLAAAIRRREVSARAVLEAHLEKAQQVNPALNAIVQDRFADARREADLADARVARGDQDLPPLHGVPCTIKECFAVAGMPQSSGLVSRRDIIPDTDCVTVARLRKAGAIPIGVTNVSELCMWMETHNRLYGRTNNPYDVSRIVGGSSGGEGAIIGAGASPFGLGADVGGSIRMPAFFNGVFGHKPTGGLVPTSGHYPVPQNGVRRFNTIGPLARRAADLMPILRILAGPDGEDLGCLPFSLGDPEQVRLSELTVYYAEDNGMVAVDEDLKVAQKRVADFLRESGATVMPLEMEAFRHSFEIWSAMMNNENETPFRVLLGDGVALPLGREFARWAMRRSDHTLPALLLGVLDELPKFTPVRVAKMVELGLQLKREMHARLGENGILLFPSYPSTAPAHLKPMWPPFNWQYTAIFNVLELPVTQVPMGLDGAGLPLGIQVVGGHGRDHVTIAVAQALEARFGGWIPPQMSSL